MYVGCSERGRCCVCRAPICFYNDPDQHDPEQRNCLIHNVPWFFMDDWQVDDTPCCSECYLKRGQ